MSLWSLALLGAGLSPVALAQDGTEALTLPEMNAQLYATPLDTRYTLWTDDSDLAPTGWAFGKVGLHYAASPLLYEYANGDTVKVVSDVFQADVLGGVAAGPMRLGVGLPVYLSTASEVVDGGFGLGDLFGDLKVAALDGDEAPVGLGLSARLQAPTATTDLPLRSEGWGWEVLGIADTDLGERLLLAVNLGTRGDPAAELEQVTWNDRFVWRAGAGLHRGDQRGASLDFAGQVAYSIPLSDSAGHPAEVLLGAWARRGDSPLVMRGGIGTGLNDGLGTPAVRLVASVGYEPMRVKDSDGDGLVDRNDTCPEEPEDIDRYQDTDGCPDPSVQVHFTILDPDGEFVHGVQTAVQTEVGQHSGGADFGLELHPGTYRIAATADGFGSLEERFLVPAGKTSHAVEFTLTPGFGQLQVRVQGEGGVAIPARVVIGEAEPVAVGADAALELKPDAGSHTLVISAEGYRQKSVAAEVKAGELTEVTVELEKALAKVTAEKIEILQKVYFDTGKATIRQESHQLLDDVAGLMKEHADIRKVSVEGHTDSRGSASFNRDLSRDRAASVVAYLVARGVAAERLQSQGFGEDRPVNSANNEPAWEQNRRVEFVILERSEPE